ncbi:hypothetical protein C8R43DRAFT_1140582 [Mycena crocata]|nr:hypothetical protein C8R43DRAFT_1140582 [Mycena crocata]
MSRSTRCKRQRAEAAVPGSASASGSHSHSFSFADLDASRENAPVQAFIHRLSDDFRRVYSEEVPVLPPSPVKELCRQKLAPSEQQPPPPLDFGQAAAFDAIERYSLEIFDNDHPPPPPAPRKSKKKKDVKPADPALHAWRSQRDKTLSLLMRRDGPGEADLATCPGCKGASCDHPSHRCEDCFGDVLYCTSCIVERHKENPLHRIHTWNGDYFVKVPLSKLGLRVQLGHPPHEPCPAPEPANSGFVTLHVNGIHEVSVDFCGCIHRLEAGDPDEQLLKAGWFPATLDRPQTCASLAVLERYHQDTLQSKVTMYDFYAVLEKLTDNTGIKPPDRYHEWIRMCREFRHIILCKRGGRAIAYDPTGVEGTEEGELALRCPACPRPGVNLNEGWETATPEQRHLYTLFLALDACFRLKRRLISSELRDPDLGSGWAFMCETMRFRSYLCGCTNQKEMETCSGLAALDHANTKFSRGYSTTGVGMGVCARHEFVQPNGVGDLQKGERFANIDYIFACILKHVDEKLCKLISYDIVCAWKVHLLRRLKEDLPPHKQMIILETIIRFVIPKMHIHSHTMIFQLLYSLNLLIGCAQVDGEGIERPWSWIAGAASSTIDMGPGSRHDIPDCLWSYWNWLKLLDLVASLRRRMERAKTEGAEQAEAFQSFSEQQTENVPEWKKMVEAFERDPTNPNPYAITIKGATEANEAEEAERGVPPLHNVSASAFISSGLDVEEEQRRVRVQAELKKAQTTEMQFDMKSLRTKLNRNITRFRKLQRTYMPASLPLLADQNLPAKTLAEDVPLLLPSALTPAQRERCVPGLANIESLMRDAQCRMALSRLRIQLHIKSRLLTIKQPGRLYGACAGGDVSKISWMQLRREDIRCMADAEDERQRAKKRKAQAERQRQKRQRRREEGALDAEEEEDEAFWEDVDEGHDGDGNSGGPENVRLISWIWLATDGTDAGMKEALRVEWCKAYARTRRWREEEELLAEEYRRVGVSFDYEAAKWDARAAANMDTLPHAEAIGARAYALRQAQMYRDLKSRGEKTWTEPKAPKGAKKQRFVPPAMQALQTEIALRDVQASAQRSAQAVQTTHGVQTTEAPAAPQVEEEEEDDDANWTDDESERGDGAESDEEFIMAGDGYDV